VSGRPESASGIPASISPVRRETLERPGSALGRPESVSDLALVLVRRAWVWLPGWASGRLVSGSSRPTEGDRWIVLVGADLCHQSRMVGTLFVPTRTGHGVHMHGIGRFAFPIKHRSMHEVSDRVGTKSVPILQDWD
jgi:hypothetical protein